MKVAIIGQGYVGSSLGLMAHSSGHKVVGVELNLERIERIRHECPYILSNSFQVVSECDIIILALPTPLTEDGLPNLTYLIEACQKVRNYAKPGTMIVNESTSHPGTLRNIVKKYMGDQFSYAVAPERIDPGNTEWNIGNTPRLLGVLDESDYAIAFDFYSTICKEVVRVSSAEVAELAKLLENTFRMINIALVNEISKFASKIGISITEVIQAASTKPFGYMPFFPSAGVGGHCIPVDPVYLSHEAKANGSETKLIDCARAINESMPEFVVEEIRRCLGGEVCGKLIQISGIAYKPDVSDTRESAALAVLKLLRKKGADVIWHDDVVGNWNSETSKPIQRVDLGVIAVQHSGVDLSPWEKMSEKVIDVSSAKTSKWRKFP